MPALTWKELQDLKQNSKRQWVGCDLHLGELGCSQTETMRKTCVLVFVPSGDCPHTGKNGEDAHSTVEMLRWQTPHLWGGDRPEGGQGRLSDMALSTSMFLCYYIYGSNIVLGYWN